MSKQRIKLHLDHLESNISPLSNTPVWPCMQCRNLLQCFFLQASPALENTHTGECAHLETGSNPHWDHSSQDRHLAGNLNFDCAATKQCWWWTGSHRLGGRCTALQTAAGGCVLTAVEETRHFQLKLDCVHMPERKREENSIWQKGESWEKKKKRNNLIYRLWREEKSESKSPGDVTRWHHLPERVDLRSSPPTTSPLLLLQVRLQVVFGSNQPALNKVERGYIRRERISGFSDSK